MTVNKKRELFDAQEIGWMTDRARQDAALSAKERAVAQATLAYQRAYAETYDETFKALFERSVYESSMGKKSDAEMPF